MIRHGLISFQVVRLAFCGHPLLGGHWYCNLGSKLRRNAKKAANRQKGEGFGENPVICVIATDIHIDINKT